MPITYKCPGCGSVMAFDGASGMLKCSNCGNTITVDDYEARYKKQSEAESKSQEAEKEERGQAKQMKIYHCQSCGAELLADEFTSATFCSYCGNSTLIEDRFNNEFKPDRVIPFKIDRNEAVEIYRAWLKKGILTPKTLSSSSTIEKISGVYVPFWLYDYQSESQMHAHTRNIRIEHRGDTEYEYTDHFQVYRDVAARFEKIPADASEKMPDDAMDKLEPYDYADMTEFNYGYISGYLSERYNYEAGDIEERARARADRYITEITRDTIRGYDSVEVENNNTSNNWIGTEYALMPVWMLNYRFAGKDFSFFLNGQTGKIVADRPVSNGRTAIFALCAFAITFIITMFGGLFFV